MSITVLPYSNLLNKLSELCKSSKGFNFEKKFFFCKNNNNKYEAIRYTTHPTSQHHYFSADSQCFIGKMLRKHICRRL